jgi:hypothetical protein
MNKKLYGGLGISIMVIAGCAAHQEITRFESKAPERICIAKHEAVKEGFLETLKKELERHGASTKVVNGIYEERHGEFQGKVNPGAAEACDALAFYVAHWHWDLALYMRYADIWLTDADGVETIARTTYETGGGLDKFIDAEEKIAELVGQMYDKGEGP